MRTAVPLLDRVIDINYYPSVESAASNPRWRPVGLGLMGLQNVFFALRLPFDFDEAQELSTRISEEIYLTALEVSCGLAQRHGAHPSYDETRVATGVLQPDLWDVTGSQTERWAALRSDIAGHLVSRLVAFFATGDTIVANNLVLNLYRHINSPEGRLYLVRQLFEEAVHVHFYLTLLDTYVPDETERHEAFAAVDNIASIKAKADFCFHWIDSVFELDELQSREHRGRFLLNLICFAAVIEELFFYGAFVYVYFLRSRGLLNGLASGTNWVFRDESMHMAFAFDVVDTVRAEEPDLFDDELAAQVRQMLIDGVDAEAQFADDLLGGGVAGLSTSDMRCYLEYVADRRMERLDLPIICGSKNPLAFIGAPGRPGALELLRAQGVRLPGRCLRRGGAHGTVVA